MNKTKAISKKSRNDIIFITALLIVTALAALALFLFRAEGDTVIVTVDGEFFGEYALSEDRTVEIIGENGRNLLVIQNGEASISEASCPDGICSSHRPISRSGESIICLPNKVVVEVHSQEKEQADIIA